MKLPDTDTMYSEMGKATAGRILCRKCGYERIADAESAAKFMRFGWPKCCGETMELITKRQASQRTESP